MASKVAIVSCENYDSQTVERSVEKAINLIGGIEQFAGRNKRVLIKPNLCLPEPPEKCLTTHPNIVKKIAKMCLDVDSEVIVGDNPVGNATKIRLDHIWQHTGLADVVNELDCKRSLLDTQMRMYSASVPDKEYKFYISEEVLKVDTVINIPKFKTHSLMTFTGAVKNLYGLLPGNSKKKLHSELPEKENFARMLLEIYKVVQPRLHIMDAVIGIEGEGPSSQGEKRYVGLILASTDGIALDSVSTKLMNIDAHCVPTNRLGGELGLGTSNIAEIEIVGEDLEKYIMRDYKLPTTHRYHTDLTKRIFELSRAYIEIDVNNCKGCGLCSENCSALAIEMCEGKAKIDQESCISCMTCHEICPSKAVLSRRSDFYMKLTNMSNKDIEVNNDTEVSKELEVNKERSNV